jgi:hypothetical protein
MIGPATLLALVASALLNAAAPGEPAPQARTGRDTPGQPIVSGLGARGPQRFDGSVPQVASALARDAALALYDASRAEDDAGATATRRRRGRTALDFARFDGPSIGYATIAALTLGAALMRVRRPRAETIRALPARASARPASKRPLRG